MPNPMKKLGWLAVATLGAAALGVIALKRGESINALWLVVAAVCTYFIAFRFYEPVRKVLESDESVVIPWLPRRIGGAGCGRRKTGGSMSGVGCAIRAT